MATKAWLDETADERFDAGCAGMGPVGIGCQSWMALSGVDPITGKEATPAQKVLYGAQAVLNATGFVRLTAGVGGSPKAIAPKVKAEGKIGDQAFTDVNQTARPGFEAKFDQPTLIADRVNANIGSSGKPLPNASMATAHAEIGIIQQAYNDGKTKGQQCLSRSRARRFVVIVEGILQQRPKKPA